MADKVKVESKKLKEETGKKEPTIVKKKTGIQDGIDTKDSKSKSRTTEQEKVKTEPRATAKAGKHSAKALKEAEEKKAKEERKSAIKIEKAGAKPKKVVIKIARSKLERRSKNYRKNAALIDAAEGYELKEALELAAKTSSVKFDAAVELHIRLNVDPRQADQNVRGTVALPAGTGKSQRIAVLAEPADAEKAKKAGADQAGEEILQKIDKEVIDFDVLIASPFMMAKLGKYARLLGPKGLMPNPKSGTVAKDVAKAVSEAKTGKVEYRVDSTGIIHLSVGKVSFGSDKLLKNARAVVSSVRAAKPNSIKGSYVTSVFVTTTMGPSIKLALTEIQ